MKDFDDIKMHGTRIKKKGIFQAHTQQIPSSCRIPSVRDAWTQFYDKLQGFTSLFILSTIRNSGPGSSVSIETNYWLNGPGIESPVGRDFPLSRLALGPTQSPVQWGTGSSPGVKCGWGVLLTTHPLLMPRSRKGRAIPVPTLEAI
jgi:hypothetical protein